MTGSLGDFMVTALSLQPRGRWYRVWPVAVTFGGCCHPSHPAGVVLGFWWPGHPILVVPASLSPQGHRQRGEQGTEANRWGGTLGHGGGPSPHDVPNTLLSPQLGERCPQAAPALCLWCRRAPTPWRTTLSPTWGHDQDHGDLTASCIERARRAWPGTGTSRPWRADGCADTLGTEPGAEWVAGRPSPSPWGLSPTFPHAGQGQGELAHEVVAGGVVVILHHEAQQRQLGRPHLETQRLLPARVEPCGTGMGVGAAPGTPGTPAWRPAPPSPVLPRPRLSCRLAL